MTRASRLAEQLAGIDIRSYVDLRDLRNDVLHLIDAHPDDVKRRAFNPFCFLSSVELLVPHGFRRGTPSR